MKISRIIMCVITVVIFVPLVASAQTSGGKWTLEYKADPPFDAKKDTDTFRADLQTYGGQYDKTLALEDVDRGNGVIGREKPKIIPSNCAKNVGCNLDVYVVPKGFSISDACSREHIFGLSDHVSDVKFLDVVGRYQKVDAKKMEQLAMNVNSWGSSVVRVLSQYHYVVCISEQNADAYLPGFEMAKKSTKVDKENPYKSPAAIEAEVAAAQEGRKQAQDASKSSTGQTSTDLTVGTAVKRVDEHRKEVNDTFHAIDGNSPPTPSVK